MNPTDAGRWKSDVLDQILAALAAAEVESTLIFKGARILNLHLGGGRQSLDLDTNLAREWVLKHSDRDEQRALLERSMSLAIRRHFERQNPVRYQLIAMRVSTHPPLGHPWGWDAFKVRLNVDDLTTGARSLPAIEIDVAAPEELLESSLTTIDLGGRKITAYTLERIAGEKLRAFLSSLPEYRAKVQRPGTAVRAKDLYDLARIRRARPISNSTFWVPASLEFRMACKSRYIDCRGLETFQQQWQVTRQTYEQTTVPGDIPFAEAETELVLKQAMAQAL